MYLPYAFINKYTKIYFTCTECTQYFYKHVTTQTGC